MLYFESCAEAEPTLQHRIAAQHARHAGQLQKLMTRRHVSLMARCQHWPQRRRGRRRGLVVTRGGCRRRARQSNRAGRGGRRRGVMKTWSCFDPWVRADNRTNNNAGASLGASVAPRCSVARCRTVLLTFIARTAVLRSVIANVHVECYRQSCSRLCQASDSVQVRFLLRHHTHALSHTATRAHFHLLPHTIVRRSHPSTVPLRHRPTRHSPHSAKA